MNTLDPLISSNFSIDELSEICDQNETNAAKIVQFRVNSRQNGRKLYVENGSKTYYQIYQSPQKNII